MQVISLAFMINHNCPVCNFLPYNLDKWIPVLKAGNAGKLFSNHLQKRKKTKQESRARKENFRWCSLHFVCVNRLDDILIFSIQSWHFTFPNAGSFFSMILLFCKCGKVNCIAVNIVLIFPIHFDIHSSCCQR